mmetsp:Transcript_25889/g.72218  ORF Transcript_25889/g.72218 Transcript_25889/m.72218 type:complete len:461 (-) Transcript_25889:49-1431(-)
MLRVSAFSHLLIFQSLQPCLKAAVLRGHRNVSDSVEELVAFYVYEGPGTEWLRDCDADEILGSSLLPDVAMHHQMEKHPWRTWDPEAASLFFVPAYVSASVKGHCGDHLENMASTARMLNESPYYKKHDGADHIISSFAWYAKPTALGNLEPHTKQMIVAHFEALDKPEGGSFSGYFSRGSVTVPYGPFAVEASDIERANATDFDAREHDLFFMGQADCRPAYMDRRMAIQQLRAAFGDAVLIQTPGEVKHEDSDACDQLPTELAADIPSCGADGPWSGCAVTRKDHDLYLELGGSSKFALVLPGDTPSTSRLYDAIQFGSIPIVVSHEGVFDGERGLFEAVAMPFPDDVPWSDFAIFIDEAAFREDPVGQMRAAVKRAKDPARREALARARPALDWTAGGQCVATAVLKHVARRFLGRETSSAVGSKICRDAIGMKPTAFKAEASPPPTSRASLSQAVR